MDVDAAKWDDHRENPLSWRLRSCVATAFVRGDCVRAWRLRSCAANGFLPRRWPLNTFTWRWHSPPQSLTKHAFSWKIRTFPSYGGERSFSPLHMGVFLPRRARGCAHCIRKQLFDRHRPRWRISNTKKCGRFSPFAPTPTPFASVAICKVVSLRLICTFPRKT